MIRIYHNPFPHHFQVENTPPRLPTLYLAAVVNTHRPQEAYQLTREAGQQSDGRVHWLTTNRRTQIGDVLELVDDGGQLLLVDRYGFKELAGRFPWQETAVVTELLAQLQSPTLAAPLDDEALPPTAVHQIRQLRHHLQEAVAHIQALHHVLLLALPVLDEARAGVDFGRDSWLMGQRRQLMGALYQQACWTAANLQRQPLPVAPASLNSREPA